MRRLLLILIVLLWLPILLHRTGPESATQADKIERNPVDFDEDRGDESDVLLERIRLYLSRHGNNGKIDPQRRLETVKAEYRHRIAEEASRAISPQTVGGTNWVSLGPTNGAGRATAIAPHPTDPNTLYIGAAGGGVWKTTNSGISWTPLTDFINDLSVGAVAIAPSSPNIIYLGTGEGGIAIDFIPGIGFLKSTDGGASWIFPSSVLASKFYRISVHPTNPQELVAGTNAGGFRSTDGGTNWTRVIDPTQYQDVADIVRNPSNPLILYATTWDERRWCARPTAQCNISAPRVLKSTDGGATWAEKSSGLPVSSPTVRVNRLSLAISTTNPSVIYLATSILDSPSATTEASHVYKTSDGAESWSDLPTVSGNSDVNISQFMRTQGWYDNTIVVSPTDQNIVIAGGVTYIRSTDGGSSWGRPTFTGSSVHVDVHDLRYRGSTLYIANDGGIWSSPDNGQTAVDRNAGLVTRQYYGLALDSVNRNRILGGMQDNGTNRRPDSGSTSWTGIIGGDGFECGVNSLVPSIAYGTVQFGAIFRTKDAASNSPAFSNITPPYSPGESGPFLSLLTVDPGQPSTIYTGTNRVWRSTNAGDIWEPLGTTTTDGSIWPSIFSLSAIAVARADSSIIMASGGTRVFRSTNGGVTWAGLTSGLPTNIGINNLEIDPNQPNIAYAALAGTIGQRVYRTTDAGATWQPRSTGLPGFSAQVVRVDPTDSNVLFCGTDVGVYRSTDQGVSWSAFGTGLPDSSVHDLRILEDGSAVRVATHGRGIWELEVPPTGNTPPTVSVTNPIAIQTIVRGSSLEFTGRVTDPDLGDSISASWIFPDTWEKAPAPIGVGTVSHVFNLAGIFPVSLTARDSHGAIGSSAITIRVTDPDDDCSTPLVIPGEGPFPFTNSLNNETAETQATDPGPPCTPNLGRGRTLWLEFTPATTGTYQFTTCGTSVDTVLSAWTGPRCGPYTAVANACNDDAAFESTCAGSLGSDLTFPIAAGQTIRIQASGIRATDAGFFVLTVARIVPKIVGVSISGKNLLVAGTGFDDGARILVDGEQKKTRPDDFTPSTALVGKKVGKKIARGQTVTVQVRNSDGSLSNEFSFTRPS